MKVLNILTSPLTYDGISMSVMNYFRNIDVTKVQMDFLVPSVDEKIREEIQKRKRTIFLLNSRKKNPLKYMKQLTKIIEENNYDIIQAHGSSAILCIEMIAAKRAGCKIRIAHSRNTKATYKLIDKLLRPIFYRTYTYGFACGEDAGRWLFGNRKFTIINNGKDFSEFEYNEKIRKEIRDKYDLNNKIVIGHVGTFNYQKNHKFLIEIFQELIKNNTKKYKLVLIGDGKLRPEIERMCNDLRIKEDVLFVGRTNEVGKWLQAMDIMVFPSRFEGFPNVLVEWQMAGLPSVISSNITKDVKITDLVRFESLDKLPKEWAKDIENIKIEDREKIREKMKSKIKEKGYDIKENSKRLEEIYEMLLNKNIK